MLTIEYDPIYGATIADGNVRTFIYDIYSQGFTHYVVGSENIILAARALVATDRIPHSDIQFSFRGQIISVDKCGIISPWPRDFCISTNTWLSQILNARFKNAKG